jgi:phosphatidylglycerophosphatase A
MKESSFARLALIIAEFFYFGRFPKAPGTAGSLGALLIWLPALYFWPWWTIAALIIVLFVIGLWASNFGISHYGTHDPKQVVIDEVVGIGIPFLIIAPNYREVIVAFLLFRFFDIWKPWPIRAIEKKFPNNWGIMLDDVVAGIFALVILYAIRGSGII